MKLKDLVDVSHYDYDHVSHYEYGDTSHDHVSQYVGGVGSGNWMESNFTSSMKNTQNLLHQSGCHSFLSLPYTQVYGASTNNHVDLVSTKDNSSAPLFSVPNLPLPSTTTITTFTSTTPTSVNEITKPITKLELTQAQMEKGTRRFSAQETKYLFSLFNSGMQHPDSESLAVIARKIGKSARSLQTWYLHWSSDL